MDNIDRSFESALKAVLDAGAKNRNFDSRSDTLLKRLVNIGYEHQFSPEDRISARKKIKDAVAEHLGQNR